MEAPTAHHKKQIGMRRAMVIEAAQDRKLKKGLITKTGQMLNSIRNIKNKKLFTFCFLGLIAFIIIVIYICFKTIMLVRKSMT